MEDLLIIVGVVALVLLGIRAVRNAAVKQEQRASVPAAEPPENTNDEDDVDPEDRPSREIIVPAVASEAPPAVTPKDLPVAVAHEDGEKAATTVRRYPELQKLVSALASWEPKWHTSEKRYHLALLKHLRNEGYGEDQIMHEPRVRPEGGTSWVKPDFVVGGRRSRQVLVEVKLGITGWSHAHQAVGQVQNYLNIWRRKGATILVVCDEFRDEMRDVVRQQVRGWQAMGLPVMAYFVRADERHSAVPGER